MDTVNIITEYNKRGGNYVYDGSCVNASREAQIWLGDFHEEICTGLLVAEGNVLHLSTGKTPPTITKDCSTSYILQDDCIWIRTLGPLHETSFSITGAQHFVKPVILSDGRIAAIDWSLQQFKNRK